MHINQCLIPVSSLVPMCVDSQKSRSHVYIHDINVVSFLVFFFFLGGEGRGGAACSISSEVADLSMDSVIIHLHICSKALYSAS